MIIFLYGPDSYRRNLKLKEFVAEYRARRAEIDMMSVDLEDEPEDWVRAKDFLNQPSMFVDSKVLVIKESGTVEEKDWLKALKNETETERTFVLISDKDAPTKKRDFLLKKPVQNQEFTELQGDTLKLFINKEGEKRGLSFSPEAAELFRRFIEYLPARSGRAVNELEKLALVKLSSPIQLSELRTVLNFRASEQVFLATRRFLMATGAGAKLAILEDLVLRKEAAAYIFNALAYRAGGALIMKLASYDVLIKSGKLDYEEALLDLAIS